MEMIKTPDLRVNHWIDGIFAHAIKLSKRRKSPSLLVHRQNSDVQAVAEMEKFYRLPGAPR